MCRGIGRAPDDVVLEQVVPHPLVELPHIVLPFLNILLRAKAREVFADPAHSIFFELDIELFQQVHHCALAPRILVVSIEAAATGVSPRNQLQVFVLRPNCTAVKRGRDHIDVLQCRNSCPTLTSRGARGERGPAIDPAGAFPLGLIPAVHEVQLVVMMVKREAHLFPPPFSFNQPNPRTGPHLRSRPRTGAASYIAVQALASQTVKHQAALSLMHSFSVSGDVRVTDATFVGFDGHAYSSTVSSVTVLRIKQYLVFGSSFLTCLSRF